MHDVIIVGGGPTGSHAASRLAALGYRVLVLERRQELARKCCTGIIGLECVNFFGIEEKVILRYVNSARLYSPAGRLLQLRRDKPQACILDRAAFDRRLAEQAQENGAEYLFGAPVKGLSPGGDSVQVTTALQGKSAIFTARAVVVASGFGTGLPAKLGLGECRNFVLGGQAEVEIAGIDEIEVYFGRDIAPGFFAWLVPTSPRTARVGLLTRQHPRQYLERLLLSLQSEGKIVSGEAEMTFGGVPLRAPDRTYAERVLVIGDAAGQVKPTTGGGIYYGLLGAEMAVKTLQQALQGNDFSTGMMRRYEQAWRQKLGRELRAGYRARWVSEHLSDRQLDRLFGFIQARGVAEALLKAEDLSFDWHRRAISRLIGQIAITGAAAVIRAPFVRRRY